MNTIAYLAVTGINSLVTPLYDLVGTALCFIVPLAVGIVIWRVYTSVPDPRPTKIVPLKPRSVLNDFPVDDTVTISDTEENMDTTQIQSVASSIDLDKSKSV